MPRRNDAVDMEMAPKQGGVLIAHVNEMAEQLTYRDIMLTNRHFVNMLAWSC